MPDVLPGTLLGERCLEQMSVDDVIVLWFNGESQWIKSMEKVNGESHLVSEGRQYLGHVIVVVGAGTVLAGS